MRLLLAFIFAAPVLGYLRCPVLARATNGQALMGSFEGFSKLQKRFEASKEESRKLRRTIYSREDWKRHRSSARYFKELRKMPRSIVLRGLTLQALGVALTSATFVVYNLLVEHRVLPSLPLMTLPLQPFSLTSPSLGLLLVFRTNAAYARWKDARSTWGVVSAKSFDLMRQAVHWLPDPAAVAEMARHTVAFNKCLYWELTHKGRDARLERDLGGVMTAQETAAIMASPSKSKAILMRLTKIIMKHMDRRQQTHMDKSIMSLSICIEQCDVLASTPIPLVYTRHTCRFLLLWLLTVPMALYPEFPLNKKLLVPVISFLTSIFLFGIEDLGVQVSSVVSLVGTNTSAHSPTVPHHNVLYYFIS
jgi:putative membrane protein